MNKYYPREQFEWVGVWLIAAAWPIAHVIF